MRFDHQGTKSTKKKIGREQGRVEEGMSDALGTLRPVGRASCLTFSPVGRTAVSAVNPDAGKMPAPRKMPITNRRSQENADYKSALPENADYKSAPPQEECRLQVGAQKMPITNRRSQENADYKSAPRNCRLKNGAPRQAHHGCATTKRIPVHAD
jgi:hypothetical protein